MALIETNTFQSIHVIAGLDARHGGPSYSIPRLCQALTAAGVGTALLSVGAADASGDETSRDGYADCRFRWDYAHAPVLRNLRCSAELVRALRVAAAKTGVIHDHGLWLAPNVQAGRVAARAGKPLVVSPRGMLAPAALAFSRLRKKAFWHMLQGPAIRHAACLHATSLAEYREIRAFGLTSPVAIIPNGVDLPKPPEAGPAAPVGDRVALSLGRIHPKKGLDRLLHAWAKVEPAYPEWRLRIVGPAEDAHDEDLRRLATTLDLTRVSIEGPIYGEAKDAAYSAAELFVLATLNENFGLTVAEALAAGTPVLATQGAPWSGLQSEGCGWWVEHGVDALAAGLATAMSLPRKALSAMGVKGRTWMARDFSWDRVARDTLAVYRWLTVDDEAPPSVRFD